jgi:WS/DGAT/MGAT family acyltransferase
VRFFSAFNDITPKPPKPGPIAPWEPDGRVSSSKMMFKAYVNNLRKPGQIVKMGRGMMASRKRVKEGLAEGEFKENSDVPATRFNGKLTPHRVVGATKFDFETIRQIKSTVEGATVNDTVLAIVGGAMRRYLEAKDELPEESLITGCPVNVRDESEKDLEGNMVGMMTTRLCTDVDDPAERLAQVHADAVNAKAYMQAQGSRMMAEYSETIPGGMQAMFMKLSAATGLAEKNLMMNTTVTNVPGAPEQLYMCGAQIIDSFGLGPISPGMGLFHTVNSMVMKNKGTLTLAFTCCREIMPDPEFYAECIEASFEELCDACLPKKKASKPRAAARKKAR